MKIDRDLPDTRHVADLAGKVKQLKVDFVTAEDDGFYHKAVKFKNRFVNKSDYHNLKEDSKDLGSYLVEAYRLDDFKSLPERGVELIQHLERMIEVIKFPSRQSIDSISVQQAGDAARDPVLDSHDGNPVSPHSSHVSVSPEDPLSVSQNTLLPSPSDSPVAPAGQSPAKVSDDQEYKDPARTAERTGPLSASSLDSIDNIRMDFERAREKLNTLTVKNEKILSPAQQELVKKSGITRDLRIAEEAKIKFESLAMELSEVKDEFEKTPHLRTTREQVDKVFGMINALNHRPEIRPKETP